MSPCARLRVAAAAERSLWWFEDRPACLHRNRPFTVTGCELPVTRSDGRSDHRKLSQSSHRRRARQMLHKAWPETALHTEAIKDGFAARLTVRGVASARRSRSVPVPVRSQVSGASPTVKTATR